MSGITAAAQSSGCCCRPSEGCTCESPTRPGAVLDRSITAISVTGEVTVDHAYRSNGSPYFFCGCPCSPIGVTLGSGATQYGYRPQGSVVDPDALAPGDPCYPGCTQSGCAGCAAYTLSASTGTVVCQQVAVGAQDWASRVLQFGDNIVGQWSWQGRRVGYCTSSQGIRVRSYCQFLYRPIDYAETGIDPNGAFIDFDGNYVQTQYGDTLGRLHAIQYARVIGVPTLGGPFCGYTVRIGMVFAFTWEILKALAENGQWSPTAALPEYYADYFKPCLSPSDTVLGTYAIGDVPQYDRYTQDQECGAIRAFEDLRVSFPNTIEVA